VLGQDRDGRADGAVTGKAKLDSEQQQIQSLQSEIDRLKEELPPPKTNQVVE